MLNSSSPGSWRVGASTSRVYSIKTESARNPRNPPCGGKPPHGDCARRTAAAIGFAHASGPWAPLTQKVPAVRTNQLIIPSSSSSGTPSSLSSGIFGLLVGPGPDHTGHLRTRAYIVCQVWPVAAQLPACPCGACPRCCSQALVVT